MGEKSVCIMLFRVGGIGKTRSFYFTFIALDIYVYDKTLKLPHPSIEMLTKF